jgi:hypothetical protein
LGENIRTGTGTYRLIEATRHVKDILMRREGQVLQLIIEAI